MGDFDRAYRDPKSPLQPLTPLSVNPNFSFNIGGDGSLNSWLNEFDLERGKSKSESFLSPQPQPKQQSQQFCTPNILVERSPIASGCQCDTRMGSPSPNKKSGFFSFKRQLCCTPNKLKEQYPITSGCQCGCRKNSPLPIKKTGLFSLRKSQIFSPCEDYSPNLKSPLPFKKSSLFKFKKPQIVVPRMAMGEEQPPDSQKNFVKVLKKVGMLKYWSFFKLHGIHFGRFQSLTCSDFEEMGINKPKHLDQLLKGVQLARTM